MPQPATTAPARKPSRWDNWQPGRVTYGYPGDGEQTSPSYNA